MSLSGCEILLASPHPSLYDSLTGVLDHCQCRVYRSATCEMTAAFLREHPVGVVVCDADLPDGSWRDVLDGVLDLACPPNFIVASRLTDERLWAEVLNLGGYDVLATPFEADETIGVVTQALSDWDARRANPLKTTAAAAGHYGVSRAEVRPRPDSLLKRGAAD